MNQIFITLAILFSFFSSFSTLSAEDKQIKTLVLLIATDDKPAYKELQRIWEAYMNSDPTHFDVYFLRANPNLDTDYVINKNEIIVKTGESLVPGIVNKTLLALEAFAPELSKYDFVIRSNLSSFYSFPHLLNFLKMLPKTNCYCGWVLFQPEHLGLPQGVPAPVPFVSGAGIIWSTDLVRLLIKDQAEFAAYKSETPDDVFFGIFYQQKKIPAIRGERWDFVDRADWEKRKEAIPPHAYAFRAKRSFNPRSKEDPYADEIYILHQLLKKYYSVDLDK